MTTWLLPFVEQFLPLYHDGMLDLFVINHINSLFFSIKGVHTATGVFRAVVLLVVNDIPATSSLLNMIASNGFYGCRDCEGERQIFKYLLVILKSLIITSCVRYMLQNLLIHY